MVTSQGLNVDLKYDMVMLSYMVSLYVKILNIEYMENIILLQSILR